MVKKIFKGVTTMFLPVTLHPIPAKRFIARGGERQRVVDNETTHIISRSSSDVEQHFSGCLGLLPYFRERCWIVDEDWVPRSVEAYERQREKLWSLDLVHTGSPETPPNPSEPIEVDIAFQLARHTATVMVEVEEAEMERGAEIRKN